ncbi:MAG TPA: C10 family peptidase, partial [Saprospiraceae bacterium]|nr:C10 family peptidase [Saprospiraceae bacterium]
MKKILYISLMLITLVKLHGQTINTTTALQVAVNYLRQQTGRPDVDMVISENMSRNRVSTLYHVCNSSDGKGFVIVAGIMSSHPILAYSPDGNFSIDNAPEVVKLWMQGYEEQLEAIESEGLAPSPEISGQWEGLVKGTSKISVSRSLVGPLLSTTWDQGSDYNAYCPQASGGDRAPTGCVATAMAQIMKYWNYPVSGTHYLTDVDDDASDGIAGTFTGYAGGDLYDWDSMPDDLSDPGTTDDEIEEVAMLMYGCGIAAKMNYGTSSSGAIDENARDAFQNIFGYSSCSLIYKDDYDGSWPAKIKENLMAGRPVYYSGSRLDSDGYHGHAWVCDGYFDDYFHMNWGWSGSNDCFVTLDDLNPYLSTRHYNYDQAIIENIEPPGCLAYYEGVFPTILSIPIAVETNDYIHINGGTVSSGSVVLNAGNEILLEPGSSVLEGATGHFYIEGCNDESFQTEAKIENRSIAEGSDMLAANTLQTDFSIYPNPFSGSTNLHFTLVAPQKVTVQVLNSTGILVATPLEQQSLE